MNVSGLLTSAGINIGLCTALSALYSVLRKRPSNASVYFGQRFAQVESNDQDPFCFARFFPLASWIVRAWETTEDDLLAIGGLDAVVFFRIIVLCIRVFAVASVICICVVLPLNYFGQPVHHKKLHTESLEVFTMANMRQGSEWLWIHCLVLYIITIYACALLYIESRSIEKKRIAYISGNPQRLSLFAILVRAIPSSEDSYNDEVTNFFENYYSSSYLSHQMIYLPGTVHKLVKDAEKMYNKMKVRNVTQRCGPNIVRCGLCGVSGKPFRILSKGNDDDRPGFAEALREQECAAALVFFRTRYAALVAAQTLQTPNPMVWVTDMAPEPPDVFWTNLCVPYKLLWVRKIGTNLAAITVTVSFFFPVSFVQSLVHLDRLKKKFSFVRKLSNESPLIAFYTASYLVDRFLFPVMVYRIVPVSWNFIFNMVTGYLPSAMLMLFLYTVPPVMSTLAAVEGPVARSGRKLSACRKVLYFMINNIFSIIACGSVLMRFDTVTSFTDMPLQLAYGVPSMAVFFMTYVLTSGWTGLACELMQPFVFLCHWLDIFVLRGKSFVASGPRTFPYHTEIPRVLVFGLLGFTASVTAPLVLPFLMVYFLLAYLVYRNQFINVYITKYDTGGLYWPIAYNTIIFSLLLMHTFVLGVFTMKKANISASFTISLIICTLLFHFCCRQRFFPVFQGTSAQVVMEMDRQDEHSGRLEEIHKMLTSAYCQFQSSSPDTSHNRQSKELHKHLRLTFKSSNSITHNSPMSGPIDLGKNGDDHELQDADDVTSVTKSIQSP